MPMDPSRWEVMDDATADLMRQMTPAQKFAVVDDLFQMARGVLGHQVEDEHPDWEPDQIKREIARRLLLGVEPIGCDLAGWLRMHADELGVGPWAADKPLLVVAASGNHACVE